MGRVYKTAMGKSIDIDNIMLRNEHVIAVGNRKVNAGGDELGAGGKVVKTRNQVMKEYYALNTPVADTSGPTIMADAPDVTVESGMDEVDEGPSTEVVVDAPVVDVVSAPEVKSLPKKFTPKEKS